MEQKSELEKHRENYVYDIRKKNREETFSKKRKTFNQPFEEDDHNKILNNNEHPNSMEEEEKTSKKPLIVDPSRKELILQSIEQTYHISQLPELIQDFLRSISTITSEQPITIPTNPTSTIEPSPIDLLHRSIIAIRKLISIENNPPIQEIIDARLIPHFINLSSKANNLYPQLKLESTWILTNICSGTTEQCECVIEKGIIPILQNLLEENEYGIVDQAIWALGNLSGDCIKYRDMILDAGTGQQANNFFHQKGHSHTHPHSHNKPSPIILDQLIKITNTTTNKNLIRQCAWTISNLCRGSVLPKYDKIKNGLICLCYIVKTGILDRDNLIDCLWAISYGCEIQKSKIERIVQTGIVEKLVQYCYGSGNGSGIISGGGEKEQHFTTGMGIESSENSIGEQLQHSHNHKSSPSFSPQHLNVLTPCLRILGNISVGNEIHTEELLKYNILELIQTVLIHHPKKSIRREVCWILSNITAGIESQVEQFLSKPELIQTLLHLWESDTLDIKREICYIFSNMISFGPVEKMSSLYQENHIMELYARLLLECSASSNGVGDVKTLEICLDTLYSALKLGELIKKDWRTEKNNIFVEELMKIPGFVEMFEKLQYHQSEGVYQRTVRIIKKYFELSDDLDI